MAATPSKPSPSNQDAAAKQQQKPEEVAATTLKEPPASSMPTYASSEASQFYTTAKVLMKNGDFETALSTIEEAITVTQAALGDNSNEVLHEALAPFHYLYGTTLLYSIEESQDATQQMTNPTEQTQQQEGAEEVTDDTQIAWENLDTARMILEQLVVQQPEQSKKFKTDLAQVYLREGDLSRHDSRYDEAIGCYDQTLALLLSTTASQFDRKIADVHYNLGLVYFLQVAETKVPEETSPSEEAAITQKLTVARIKGFQHFWECAKHLAGLVAGFCGVPSPEQLVAQAEQQVSNLKSTGDENDDSKIVGLKLQNLRKFISQLEPSADNPENRLMYYEFTEMLDEIQETVDEQENSESGVHQVTAMKEQITAAVAAQHQQEEQSNENSDIAFGSSEAAASTAAAHTVMVVKKKKKKRDGHDDGEEAKLPEPPQPAAKRPKAE